VNSDKERKHPGALFKPTRRQHMYLDYYNEILHSTRKLLSGYVCLIQQS